MSPNAGSDQPKIDYRLIFVAHNGPGPYSCFDCGNEVSLAEFVVHHEDLDQSNNDPSNLLAAHPSCHNRWHASHSDKKVTGPTKNIVVRMPVGLHQQVKKAASLAGVSMNLLINETLGAAYSGPPEEGANYTATRAYVAGAIAANFASSPNLLPRAAAQMPPSVRAAIEALAGDGPPTTPKEEQG